MMRPTGLWAAVLTAAWLSTGWPVFVGGAAADEQESEGAASESGEPAAAPEPEPEPDKSLSAEMLGELVGIRTEMNTESVGSQERVENLSDETDKLLGQYRTTQKQIEALQAFNQQMEDLVAGQERDIADLEEQLDKIELVSRDVTPLVLRMIDALEVFVELDVPFLEDERSDRIEILRRMMARSDVTESEKYRRVMEAYQIENEYGRTIEAYRSTLDKGDGNGEVTVDFLRVGRVALVYQTLNEEEAGVWNQKERRWETLDSSYRAAIRDGLRIARKQMAADLIRLPLPGTSEEL